MKKLKKTSGFIVIMCLACAFILTIPNTVFAKNKIRLVVVGANEGAPEIATEQMALTMYWGALDYRARTFHALKGKYELKYISTLFNSPNECLTGVSTGAAEMTFSGPHYMEQLEPAWKVVEAPGVFDSWDHFMRTLNTPAWKALVEKMAEKKGIKILKWMMSAGNYYLYSKKPVNSLADLKGQKIRYPGGEGFAKSLKAMGATGISLPYTEVVTALQTNMIDGLLTDMFGAMYAYNLPRFTRYVTQLTWGIQPVNIVVNSKWWDSLPPKERTAIKDVFDRIDTSAYFENAQAGITQGWVANPKTDLIRLDPSEAKNWKDIMKKSSAGILKTVDPKLIQAIESSR